MKTTMDDAGQMIPAAADAPPKAFCPRGKGIVTLRSRRRSSQPEDVTYFWRQQTTATPDVWLDLQPLIT